MRLWSLGTKYPRLMRLAADALAGPTDYANDHIWEVKLEGGRPPGLGIETSYGLRARSLRLVAGFRADGPTLTDPAQFAQPPIIRSFLPSWMRIDFSPFPGVEVEAEYWVPDSHSLAGRWRLKNTSPQFQGIRVVLLAVLDPLDGGRPMGAEMRGGAAILTGRSADLAPVAFLSGGAVHATGPAPGLELTVDLGPQAVKPVIWSCAAQDTAEASFDAARDLAGRSWDAEISRLERVHGRWVDVETGDPDWDAALALSQQAALGSFIGPTAHLRAPSLVSLRAPSNGHSPKGDGSDYDESWSGVDIGATAYVADQILAAAPELAKGLLDNFLSTQEPNGAVDGRPGPGGQKAKWLCPPRLARLAWEVFQRTGDLDFLRGAFPRLLLFFNRWFSDERGPSAPSHLSWDHVYQAKADLRPVLAAGPAWGEGADLPHVVCPDLMALLARETKALLKMSEVLGEAWARPALDQRWRMLAEAVADSWSPAAGTYRYLDRETHQTSEGRILGSGRGALDLRLRETFDPPMRVQIRVATAESRARRMRVSIEAYGINGRRREQLGVRDFHWLWDQGIGCSPSVYSRLERITVEGIDPETDVEVRSPDLRRQDLYLLLPLWAGLADPEAAEAILRRSLMNPDRYGRPHGWPIVPADDSAYAPGTPGGPWVVDLPLNSLLAQGLIASGHRAEAGDVLKRLMASVVAALKTDAAFPEAYHPEQPAGWGRRGHIAGIAPLSLFLDVAGIRLLTPDRIEVSGRHVLPWPVTLRWRGLTIDRSPEGTRVTFADGQGTFVEDGMEGTVERTIEAE